MPRRNAVTISRGGAKSTCSEERKYHSWMEGEKGQRMQWPNPLRAQLELWTWLCTGFLRTRTSGVERDWEAKDDEQKMNRMHGGSIRSGTW